MDEVGIKTSFNLLVLIMQFKAIPKTSLVEENPKKSEGPFPQWQIVAARVAIYSSNSFV